MLEHKFKSGKFVITSEVGPPKGTDIEKTIEDSYSIKDKIDAFNVTDLQSSVMRIGAFATCLLLMNKGLEPILQITCRDRNRLALQSDVLSAAVMGIRNLLLLTGDHPALGDHPQAKPVFDLDSVHLLNIIKGLQEGVDMVGNKLTGTTPKFFMGAVVNPGADPLEPQLIKMEKKIRAGAQFFQTQAIFEVDKFEKFMKRVEGFGVPIMAGIVVLKSAGMARFMNNNVAGVYVPDNLIKEISVEKEKRAEKSIEITAKIIRQLKGLCQGVHIMSLGWDSKIPAILEKSGI